MAAIEGEHLIPRFLTDTKRAKQLTLVPNRRRFSMHVAEALAQETSKSVVEAPPVVVFSQWVEGLRVRIHLLEGEAAPVSPDPETLDRLWADALDGEMDFLAESERMLAARQARAADRLLHHWWLEQTPSGPSGPPRLERGFRAARKAVARQLAARKMLLPEGWLAALAQRLTAAPPLPCELPDRLVLDGFHEITPLEQSVLDGFVNRGVAIEFAPAGNPSNTALVSRACYTSLDEELAAAAFWAREHVQSGNRHIAVVINGVQGAAERVREVFENVFEAEMSTPLRDAEECPFHLAHGERLAGHAIIQDALALLELTIGGLDRELEFPAISRWLLSPFWEGADTERHSRAQLEARLRRHGAYWWSPLAVRRLAASQKPYEELAENRDEPLRALLECLAKAAKARASGSGLHAPGAMFLGILQAWGWPGPLAKGRDAVRCTGHLNDLLEKLDGIERSSATEALSVLRQMCAERTVELRGGPLSPIQVLSPEDAAGRVFEAAWVGNMHASNWPSQPRANPFLPSLAAMRMPRSSAEGELAFCEHLTGQLKLIAPVVRFSWSRQDGDLPNSVSPLLADLPLLEPGTVPSAQKFAAAVPHLQQLKGYLGHPWLQAQPDASGWPVPGAQTDSTAAMPAEAIPGGAGMFGDQATCPMLAYLRHRLKAAFDDMPTPFADAAYRGALMHSAMYHLFTDQAGTPGLPSKDRIVPAVEQAMQQRQARDRLYEVSFRAEKQRLIQLLSDWLEFEGQRAAVNVHLLEQSYNLDVLGHGLSVRIDRIDSLADGTFLVIDYKSSSGKTTGWSQDRLRDPQLPLYAVLLSQQANLQVSGIALATVRGGECAIKGMVAVPAEGFDQITSFDNRRSGMARRFNDWKTLMSHWNQGINSLAREIVNGDCANSAYEPKHPALNGLELLLRRSEGEAWCLEHGQGDFTPGDESEGEGEEHDPAG